MKYKEALQISKRWAIKDYILYQRAMEDHRKIHFTKIFNTLEKLVKMLPKDSALVNITNAKKVLDKANHVKIKSKKYNNKIIGQPRNA